MRSSLPPRQGVVKNISSPLGASGPRPSSRTAAASARRLEGPHLRGGDSDGGGVEGREANHRISDAARRREGPHLRGGGVGGAEGRASRIRPPHAASSKDSPPHRISGAAARLEARTSKTPARCVRACVVRCGSSNSTVTYELFLYIVVD